MGSKIQNSHYKILFAVMELKLKTKMKKYLIIVLLSLTGVKALAQLTIGSGAQWVTSGNAKLVMQNINLVNNGTFTAGTGNVKFTGSQSGSIGGSSAITFYQLEIAKNSGIQLSLTNNISIGSNLSFTNGLLNLNQKNITLNNGAILSNENENSRIIGSTGGEVIYTTILNAPSSANPGNLGAFITSGSNLGTVTIRRGQMIQSGSGLSNSIARYYTITPQNNNGLNATVRFSYFDAENNGLDENSFVLYQSNDNGTSWNNLSQTTRNTSSNYVEKTGIGSLSRFALGADVVVPQCSASGVVLTAKSGKKGTVSVDWTTATETSNKGFAIEKRLASELNFTQIGYVNSKATGGNSTSPLSYSYTDNSSKETVYYRLRIEGLGGSTCYSPEAILTVNVKGGGKGGGNPHGLSANTTTEKMMSEELVSEPKLTVGPNPNNGYFFFSLEGISKPTAVTLFTMDGKLIGQYKVTNGQRQQVNGLRNGMYLLKAEGMQVFKVMVQGSGTGSNRPGSNSSSIKF